MQSLLQMLPVCRDPDDGGAPVSLPAVRVGASPGTLLCTAVGTDPTCLAHEAAVNGADVFDGISRVLATPCVAPVVIRVCARRRAHEDWRWAVQKSSMLAGSGTGSRSLEFCIRCLCSHVCTAHVHAECALESTGPSSQEMLLRGLTFMSSLFRVCFC